MTDPALLAFLERVVHITEAAGFRLESETPIPYGIQCVFLTTGGPLPVNLYHSAKKGCSAVVQGSPKHPARPIMDKLLRQAATPSLRLHNWKRWIGSDESGKGDFFGPLVVGGFRMEPEIEKEALSLGLRDSKQMEAREINEVARQLWRRFPGNVDVFVLQPLKYNELYGRFLSQGKKLNQLLAWLHSRVILKLCAHEPVDGVLIDKFAALSTLKAPLKDLKDIPLKAETRGEADPAVAAGSIIARYFFTMELDALSKRFGISFPKGAGANVDAIGREFLRRFPRERLNEVAKVHFANREKIGA